MYQLEKYHGISSRHQCPKCGDKRSLTLYIDEYGTYLADNVGRCNHESGCGYHYTPKDFFTNNPHKKPNEKRPFFPLPQHKEPDFISLDIVKESRSNESDFFTFLSNISEKAEEVADLYRLGSTKDKDVIFWQLDEKGQCRTGKIMKYNPMTGKRLKAAINGVNWVHSSLKKTGIVKENFSLSQCLFGEHLITKFPYKPICLVESEKTALIAACTMPQYIWIATGGISNFSLRTITPLRGKKVNVFPDADAIDKWKEKAKELNGYGYDFHLIDLFENEPKESTRDLADLLIDLMKNDSNLISTYWYQHPSLYNPVYIAEYSNGEKYVCFNTELATACGYEDIKELIEENKDFQKLNKIPDYIPFNI